MKVEEEAAAASGGRRGKKSKGGGGGGGGKGKKEEETKEEKKPDIDLDGKLEEKVFQLTCRLFLFRAFVSSLDGRRLEIFSFLPNRTNYSFTSSSSHRVVFIRLRPQGSRRSLRSAARVGVGDFELRTESQGRSGEAAQVPRGSSTTHARLRFLHLYFLDDAGRTGTFSAVGRTIPQRRRQKDAPFRRHRQNRRWGRRQRRRGTPRRGVVLV